LFHIDHSIWWLTDEVVLLPAILFGRCAFSARRRFHDNEDCAGIFGFLNWLMLMLIAAKIRCNRASISGAACCGARGISTAASEDGQSESRSGAGVADKRETPYPPYFFVWVANTGLISARVKKRNGLMKTKELIGLLLQDFGKSECYRNKEVTRGTRAGNDSEAEGMGEGGYSCDIVH